MNTLLMLVEWEELKSVSLEPKYACLISSSLIRLCQHLLMEEFIQFANSMKHASLTPHRRFDRLADRGMLIDLKNLPNGTRLAAPDYPNLPVYFATQIEVLSIGTFMENRNYLFEVLIDGYNETPMPFTLRSCNDNNTVCLMIWWLLESQPSYT